MDSITLRSYLRMTCTCSSASSKAHPGILSQARIKSLRTIKHKINIVNKNVTNMVLRRQQWWGRYRERFTLILINIVLFSSASLDCRSGSGRAEFVDCTHIYRAINEATIRNHLIRDSLILWDPLHFHRYLLVFALY